MTTAVNKQTTIHHQKQYLVSMGRGNHWSLFHWSPTRMQYCTKNLVY